MQRKLDMNVPAVYWKRLPEVDKEEYINLRRSFISSQSSSSKSESRITTFSNELMRILKFIDHDIDSEREIRQILTGLAFGGPFICVNTRQLKNFLGRCKSSINAGFQQLGYAALKTKAKARSCVLAMLPALETEVNLVRQWTVRYVGETSTFCFVPISMPRYLPDVTADDLNDPGSGTLKPTRSESCSSLSTFSGPSFLRYIQPPPPPPTPQPVNPQYLDIPVAVELMAADSTPQMQQQQTYYQDTWDSSYVTGPDYNSAGGWNPMIETYQPEPQPTEREEYGQILGDFSIF